MFCKECKQDFLPKSATQIFCSRRCNNRFKGRKFKEAKKLKQICSFCNKEFNCGRRNLYCSDDCHKSGFKLKVTKFLDIPQCLEDASRKLDKTLGYVRVYIPMHPEANTWGYVYEHRVIAEQMIGRRLEPDEIVHHKNGKRWDNRVENLEVMDKIEHAKLNGQREEDLEI